jgi:hypothetical protein
LQRQPNRHESWTCYSNRNEFVISTAQLEGSLAAGDLTYAGARVDQTRFWIEPPGRWVATIDEAIAAWQREEE